MTKAAEIHQLICELNEHTRRYDEGRPIITDKEWDNLYFKLERLEKETGLIYPNSPTNTISYQVVNQLNKVTHNHKMLSLAKTKNAADIVDWAGGNELIAMTKLDGLTCSLTYENGTLVAAETRGNGIVGEDITHNANVIPSIPKKLSKDYASEKIVIDGEIICNTFDFQPFKEEYKNPRNFAAGSIRLLDNKECSKRNLTFIAWDIIQGYEQVPTLSQKIKELVHLGFLIPAYQANIAPKEKVIEDAIELLKTESISYGYPIDGIVFKVDNCDVYNSLGATSHHFRGGIAYKFYNELYPTHLIDIEWSMGRTGILTPVAIFDAVEIDGTEVSRASLHNIDIMEKTLGQTPRVGQPVSVYKSNEIIPQLCDADLSFEDGAIIEIPNICPSCKKEIHITLTVNTRELYCSNPACPAKLTNIVDHFVGKKGLDIKGLSENTIAWLIDKEWITDISDVFTLKDHKEDWVKANGFGEKSVGNILTAIDNRMKSCELSAFICSLGIPLIGATYSKQLAEKFKTWESFYQAVIDNFDFTSIDGFGYEMNKAIHNYDYTIALKIANILNFNEPIEESKSNKCKGLTFVITGKVKRWKNRDELKSIIEAAGGKVTGTVTKNTTYLINNDVNSTTSKNLTAKLSLIHI